VVSGHLGSPTVDDGVVTEEEDSSVTSLEASVDLLLDTCGVSSITREMQERGGDVPGSEPF
jgi:hypothetical protein